MITKSELERIRSDALGEIHTAQGLEDIDRIRAKYVGRKSGLITNLKRKLPSIPISQRPAIGEQLNSLGTDLADAILHRENDIMIRLQAEREVKDKIDVTLPGRRRLLGRRHVLTSTLQEVERIFHGMGFEIVEGPEIETEEFNFERLNIPRDHPARDAQDSFYITDEVLLRTQTTAVDARVMIGRTPPMRILTTGRCYRRDAPDWKRMPVFHQVDGFMVGEHITLANLKGVLVSFARQLFGPETKTKFVPGYFPFTEPSAELYVYFNNQWMELGGSGMFHPRVLEYAGIDPRRFTAFAFGLGIDRQVMVRYGIPDIRMLWDNDLRVLEQF